MSNQAGGEVPGQQANFVLLSDPPGLRVLVQKLFLTEEQRQARKYARCSVFPWGISWIDGDEHVNARWEDIAVTGVDGYLWKANSPYGDIGTIKSYEYRVLLADGRSTTFLGGLTPGKAKASAAVELKPVPGTTTPVTIEQLGRLLKMGVSRVQLPRAVSLFNMGQTVSFGYRAVSLGGIALGDQLVPWSDVKWENGHAEVNVTMQKKGKPVRTWRPEAAGSNVPNYFVYNELLRAILAQRTDPRH